MAIRRLSVLAQFGFLALLAPRLTQPAIAEPLEAGPAMSLPGIDVAAMPPDGPGVEPDLSGERLVEELGSSLHAWRPSDDADAEPTAPVDPIADAFAESSRSARVAVRIDLPVSPVAVNPEVQYFLDVFTGSRRDVVTLWVSRSGRYLPMIREVLRQRGLPEELAFTAMIESGFNPKAISRVGAKGMWQFMRGTARTYGLRVDRWVDERLDPEKSTVAAAKYLRDLYNMFGSWALAQAAYNAGEVTVARAVRRTGSTDFWTIARTNFLRRETKDFVPQIYAATVIGNDPDRFGFGVDIGDPLEYETVRVPAATDLRHVGERAGIPVWRLRALNPVLVRGVTPPGGSYMLRVPIGSRDGLLSALAPRPVPRHAVTTRKTSPPGTAHIATARGDVHVVRPNDTVVSIAERYGVSVGDLLKWNALARPDRIHPGDRLRVADAR